MFELEEQQEQKPEKPSFPWLMFFVAVLFEALGFIPFLNLFTEIFASLIFGIWQAIYAPRSNPLITVTVAKILDVTFFGFLPSNIGIVIFAYSRKKFEARIKAKKIASRKAGRKAGKSIGKAIGKAIVKTVAKAA